MYLRTLIHSAAALLALLVSTTAARAELIYAIGTNGSDSAALSLYTFDGDSPASTSALLPITGVTVGTLVAIDFRPGSQTLFGLSYDGTRERAQLYIIDVNTGAATAVGGEIDIGSARGTTGDSFGFSFNATGDQIRVVTGNLSNFRLDPSSGAVIAFEGDVAYATGDPNQNNPVPQISGAAYAGDEALYDIDQANNVLAAQDPMTGTLRTIGSLGITALGPGTLGFDFSVATSAAYLQTAAGAGVQDNLYRVNLGTGAATLVGPIGSNGTLNTYDISVVPVPPAPPNPGTLRFSQETYDAGENAGSVTITVVRQGGSAGTVTVDYATSDGSATAGSDYTATSGTLTFGPGELEKAFTVTVLDDTIDESDEALNVTLANPTGQATIGSPNSAVVTIIDNETPAADPGTVRFSAATYSAGEDAGIATITVGRIGGTAGTITVSYATTDGTANANTDYTRASGTLTFAAGETTKTFTISLIDDPATEPDETVTLTLSNATGGAILGTPSTATLTILDNDRSSPPAQLLNISTRLRVQGGDKVGIGGFIITGNVVKRIIVRGIGPSLTVGGQPVAGRLQDPVIELFDGNGLLITTNDNWKDSPDRADIETSGLAPTNDAEAAIARTVNPGAYTAVLYGKDQSEGIGLVEAYDRDQGGASELANISTRGFVDRGDNVLIGGFIAGARPGATNVIVRAIGPSLTGKGVPEALQDPTVELVNRNGDRLDFSDDWRTSGDQAEVTARGLAPQDERESAAFYTVAPGDYTVIVRGKSETTGVGLVEIYNVQ